MQASRAVRQEEGGPDLNPCAADHAGLTSGLQRLLEPSPAISDVVLDDSDDG